MALFFYIHCVYAGQNNNPWTIRQYVLSIDNEPPLYISNCEDYSGLEPMFEPDTHKDLNTYILSELLVCSSPYDGKSRKRWDVLIRVIYGYTYSVCA